MRQPIFDLTLRQVPALNYRLSAILQSFVKSQGWTEYHRTARAPSITRSEYSEKGFAMRGIAPDLVVTRNRSYT